ncbi:MAG: hypothetical protein COC01_06065 [Bacteroidetes bacterium]|nr:hypothetical protein [Bacteroidia bacterium]PCH67351.1 MAG: hypothetical protein COC01_06065 [Bacteroidota bacterium]
MKNLLLSAMILGFSATGICQTTEQTEELTVDGIKGRGTVALGMNLRSGKHGSMVITNKSVQLVPGEYVNIRNNGITKIVVNSRGDVVGEIIAIDELIDKIEVRETEEPTDIYIEEVDIFNF